MVLLRKLKGIKFQSDKELIDTVSELAGFTGVMDKSKRVSNSIPGDLVKFDDGRLGIVLRPTSILYLVNGILESNAPCTLKKLGRKFEYYR